MKGSDDRQVITYSQPISEHGILADQSWTWEELCRSIYNLLKRERAVDTDGWFYIKEDYKRGDVTEFLSSKLSSST